MKSSNGEYYPALDHIRALAAFLVFTWHFVHGYHGDPVPFEGAPIFLFSIFDEGHTGVALFMTLSGYLFTKILRGRHINYSAFFWNRFIRLAPLLGFLFLIYGAGAIPHVVTPVDFAKKVFFGLVLPIWPFGGWSITVEIHFYLLLPIILYFMARTRFVLITILLTALMIRYSVYAQGFDATKFSYFTIFGRIDQFIMGMIAFQLSRSMRVRTWMTAFAALIFLLIYDQFNRAGGHYAEPSLDIFRIFLPVIEGAFYGLLIAWYDGMGIRNNNIAASLAAHVGRYSYSIYLVHFFFVFAMADFVNAHIMAMSNFYLAFAWSVPAFAVMTLIASLTYNLFEKPFLAFRRPYILGRKRSNFSHQERCTVQPNSPV